MSILEENRVKTRKVGSEDFIMMRLPASRFRNTIPTHHDPPVDAKSRYNVALLAQSCDIYSFNKDEIGQTFELHFWLQVATFNPDSIVKNADIMLPSMHWIALVSAVSNEKAQSYLKSFGFSPLTLDKIDFRKHGGSLKFTNEKKIEWTIPGRGKELSRAGVKHFIYMPSDGHDSSYHRVEALVSNTVMEQPGIIHIKTNSLEPFLFEGERFPAAVHRMTKLEADVDWQQHSLFL